MRIVETILTFIASFSMLYLFNYVAYVSKYNKDGTLKDKKKDKQIPEISLFIIMTKIDLKKVNMYKLTRNVLFINSIILAISFISSIYIIKKNLWIIGLVALVIAAALTIIFYAISYYYVKNKGLQEKEKGAKDVKNNKRNR